MMNSIWSLALLLAAVIGAGTTAYAFASTVDVPDPVLERDPISTNASETVQMTIRPNDELPANGTMTMSMEGMNDVDFKDTPPVGVTVIVTNETAAVTNQPIEPPGAAPAPTPATTPTPEPEPPAEESSEEEEE